MFYTEDQLIAKILEYKISGKKTISSKDYDKKKYHQKIEFWADKTKSKKIFKKIKLTKIEEGIQKYLCEL